MDLHLNLVFGMSIIFTSLFICGISGDCLTPWGDIGECIVITQCPKMYKILKKSPLLPMNEKVLHQAFCGIDGVNYKVCCTTEQKPQEPDDIINPLITESSSPADNSNESCTTLSGHRGNCINIKKCPKMMDILQRKPMTENNRSFLHQSHCGYEDIYPKVCCEIQDELTPGKRHQDRRMEQSGTEKINTTENCILPSGRKGNCINIKKCQRVMDILHEVPLTQETRKKLRDSQCGFADNYPKVCCEPVNEVVEVKILQKITSSSEDHCLTPWGGMGRCISINDCSDLRKLYVQNLLLPMHEKLLENARCSAEGLQDPEFKVCCGMKQSNLDRNSGATGEIVRTTIFKIPDYGKLDKRRLPHESCGPIPEERIVGGNDTRVHEFPWMALLGYNMGKRGITFRCGGTLISEEYVLTAAHCVTALAPGLKLIKVRLGEYDMKTEEDCDDESHCIGKYQEFFVQHVKPHENYSQQTFQNDIGLVKLRGSVDIRSGYIKPICLPLNREESIGRTPSNAVVTGWGATEHGTSSTRLQKVTLQIITNELCQKLYKGNRNVVITTKQLCAGGVRSKDSCSGDSGGPLQAIEMYGNRPSFVQYGIVSFGPATCGVEGLPGIYTRVDHYVQWILDNMRD